MYNVKNWSKEINFDIEREKKRRKSKNCRYHRHWAYKVADATFSLCSKGREREEENHETALFSPSLLPSSPYVPFDIHRRPGDTYLLFPIAKLQIISRRNCGTAGEKSGGRRRGEEGREIDGASNGQIYLAEEAEHATRNIRGVSYEEIDKESPLPLPTRAKHHCRGCAARCVSINEQWKFK